MVVCGAKGEGEDYSFEFSSVQFLNGVFKKRDDLNSVIDLSEVFIQYSWPN